MEVNLWNETILVDNIIKLAVSEEQELFRGGVHLLGNICLLGILDTLWSRLALIEDLCELLNAISLLDLLHNRVVLLDQVVHD